MIQALYIMKIAIKFKHEYTWYEILLLASFFDNISSCSNKGIKISLESQ